MSSMFHGMMKLKDKLHRLKQRLRWWNNACFGNIFDHITQAENEVKEAEHRYDRNPTDLNLIALNRSTTVLNQALTLEEDFWRETLVEELGEISKSAIRHFRAY
ncbi:hypothetical protein Salat_1371000 [Sesamum alatum]|uniref:Uncharacterized protein n=1 Tax=Sesamum alatum TaxID=300844 RepID=A0AAE1Y949_9LAMI|nr:hypothetical protein Salat_1371000 [Sesamum alatum]